MAGRQGWDGGTDRSGARTGGRSGERSGARPAAGAGTPRQLPAVDRDPRFLDLVRDADENPVEKEAPPAIPAG
ncbi:hypothetical protein [Streptomyces sp. NPDC056480]|uniref:hypothetical protein n=1 Tax=Streptomyces sp. NPDC056480 TaxID=3345833 RepID=UPI0036B2CC27